MHTRRGRQSYYLQFLSRSPQASLGSIYRTDCMDRAKTMFFFVHKNVTDIIWLFIYLFGKILKL